MFVQAGGSHVYYAPGVTLQVMTVATLKEIHLITLLCWASWVTGYILCKEQISHSSRIFWKWLIEEKGTAENSVSNGYLAKQHAMEYMELEEGSVSWIKWAWACLGNSQSKSRSLSKLHIRLQSLKRRQIEPRPLCVDHFSILHHSLYIL